MFDDDVISGTKTTDLATDEMHCPKNYTAPSRKYTI